MRLRWTPAAADDLESIGDYLAQHLPSFAQSTILEIYQTVLTLRSIPYRGRAGREEGTRELVLPRMPYIVVSSYLLDATRYNGLWFHQFCERNWLNLNSLLGQSVEQFAA